MVEAGQPSAFGQTDVALSPREKPGHIGDRAGTAAVEAEPETEYESFRGGKQGYEPAQLGLVRLRCLEGAHRCHASIARLPERRRRSRKSHRPGPKVTSTEPGAAA